MTDEMWTSADTAICRVPAPRRLSLPSAELGV